MKVLYVCRGNLARSQVAQTLFNKLSGKASTSAGIHVDEIVARTNPPSRMLKHSPAGLSLVIPYVEQEGVDISENLRKQLTPEMVQEADKVIVMAEEDTWPDFLSNSDKVVFWDIPDLPGLDLDEARPIFEEVKRRVQELIREIG